eukprot:GEMP01063473.1.p1 GENE.GEMP01063473.1~~GEMP01063473.1.p1  ORF type:complete len:158 (+),score=27.05 GEMP01063473.1:123-596(+)
MGDKVTQKQISWDVQKKSPSVGAGWQVRKLKVRWQLEANGTGAALFGAWEYSKGNELKGRFESCDMMNAYVDPKSNSKFFITVEGAMSRVYEFQAVNMMERQDIMNALLQAFPDIFPDCSTIPNTPLDIKALKKNVDDGISDSGKRGRQPTTDMLTE